MINLNFKSITSFVVLASLVCGGEAGAKGEEGADDPAGSRQPAPRRPTHAELTAAAAEDEATIADFLQNIRTFLQTVARVRSDIRTATPGNTLSTEEIDALYARAETFHNAAVSTANSADRATALEALTALTATATVLYNDFSTFTDRLRVTD